MLVKPVIVAGLELKFVPLFTWQIGRKYYQRYAGNPAGYMDRIRPHARQVRSATP